MATYSLRMDGQCIPISRARLFPYVNHAFRNVFFHSDVELLKLSAMHLGKSVRPDVVESSFYELGDILGSRRQELSCSSMMSTLSVERVTSRTQNEDDGGGAYEEIIQLHDGTRESRHH
jgi:hypothetical protein